ncbi:hypothetical protein Ancab_008054 [Ancistrocladus abbreviatus]
MKKTFYYNFFPTKDEELAMSNWSLNQISRTLIEIRDDNPPVDDPKNPWKITKRLTSIEATSRRLILSHNDAFDHVFRYWSLEMANHVVIGGKVCVEVWDVTEENSFHGYGPADEAAIFERGMQDCYVLGLNMGLVRARALRPGDEIGLYWKDRASAFYFKVFR